MRIWLPLIETATGSEVYTRRLAAGLEARGHDVQLDAVPHKYQYYPWFAPISPKSGTDVILTNSWSAPAFLHDGTPTLSVCHLVVHDPRLKPYKSFPQSVFHTAFVRPMERRAVRTVARNIAVSHMVRRQMVDFLGADDDTIDVVHNGVDVDFFSPAPYDRTDKIRLLFVGNPSLRKGFDQVAKIVDALGDKVAFTCVGPEPTHPLPKPKGTYSGFRDRTGVRDAYRAADMLLFPSRMEGCPYVVLEALACGLPVIGCKDTPVEEVVPEGSSIIRDADDINGYVDAIQSLASDSARFDEAREASRAHAVASLSETVWLDKTERILMSQVR